MKNIKKKYLVFSGIAFLLAFSSFILGSSVNNLEKLFVTLLTPHLTFWLMVGIIKLQLIFISSSKFLFSFYKFFLNIFIIAFPLLGLFLFSFLPLIMFDISFPDWLGLQGTALALVFAGHVLWKDQVRIKSE